MLATHKIHFVQIEQHVPYYAYYEGMRYTKIKKATNQAKTI
jgi:hypothetical protein